jgi:hypothetical protein
MVLKLICKILLILGLQQLFSTAIKTGFANASETRMCLFSLHFV